MLSTITQFRAFLEKEASYIFILCILSQGELFVLLSWYSRVGKTPLHNTVIPYSICATKSNKPVGNTYIHNYITQKIKRFFHFPITEEWPW